MEADTKSPPRFVSASCGAQHPTATEVTWEPTTRHPSWSGALHTVSLQSMWKTVISQQPPPETLQETAPETLPETPPETLQETVQETVPETSPETSPETKVGLPSLPLLTLPTMTRWLTSLTAAAR